MKKVEVMQQSIMNNVRSRWPFLEDVILKPIVLRLDVAELDAIGPPFSPGSPSR